MSDKLSTPAVNRVKPVNLIFGPILLERFRAAAAPHRLRAWKYLLLKTAPKSDATGFWPGAESATDDLS